MHISPDQTIFWQYGFFKLNATIAVHVGTDDRAGRRLQARDAQTFHRAGTLPLAEPSRNPRHRDREANRRGGPELSRESISAFWERSSYLSPQPASVP